mmetsp:Transcript_102070/g.288249  ORF Transcript_102070/g.288249 Transcript_102070/m.288249 type:complete len:367 (-) Transcript_102070:759-1859(-)
MLGATTTSCKDNAALERTFAPLPTARISTAPSARAAGEIGTYNMRLRSKMPGAFDKQVFIWGGTSPWHRLAPSRSCATRSGSKPVIVAIVFRSRPVSPQRNTTCCKASSAEAALAGKGCCSAANTSGMDFSTQPTFTDTAACVPNSAGRRNCLNSNNARQPSGPTLPGMSSSQSKRSLTEPFLGISSFSGSSYRGMPSSDSPSASPISKGRAAPRKSSFDSLSSSKTSTESFWLRSKTTKSQTSSVRQVGSHVFMTVEECHSTSASLSATYGSLVDLLNALQSEAFRPEALSAVARKTPIGGGWLRWAAFTPCSSVAIGMAITFGKTNALFTAALKASLTMPASPGTSAMFPMPVKSCSSFGGSTK